jgi:hypothetical protein
MLVNNWNTLTFQPTATTLRLSATSVVHGAPITISTTVAPSSGSGMPTGDVAILTNSTLPSSQSQTYISLSNGAGSSSVNYLPGGTYEVSGRYGGDGTFASSTSSPETLTVTPEKSNINFSLGNGTTQILSGGSVQYNAPLTLYIQPTGVSAAAGKTDGFATGTATFTIDSTSATVALNSSGVANWNPPALSVGTHTASAIYSGDASFAASSSTPVTFSVTKGQVMLNDNEVGPYTYQLAPNTIDMGGIYMNTGSSLTVGVTAQGAYTLGASPAQIPLGTTAPTGTVQVCLGTYPGLFNECGYQMVYSQIVTLTPVSGTNTPESLAVATFPNLAANQYYVSLVYNGDSNWGVEALMDGRVIIVESLPSFAATTTTLSITPTSFSGTQTAKVTSTITGAGNPGTSPTGELDFYDNDVFLTYCYWYPQNAVAGTTTTCSFEVTPSWFNQSGANQLTAVYSGDGANGPSVSNTVNFSATQTGVGDFMLAPQTPQLTVQSGSSTSVLLNLQSLSNFNGAVSLSCTPSSTQFSCGVTPTSPTLNGTTSATLTIHATVQTAMLAQPDPQTPRRWPVAAGLLCGCFLFIGGRAGRKFRRSLLFGLCFLAAMAAISCGGSSSITPPQNPINGSAAGTYSVVVTGTANGIIHNARITVLVP